MEEQLKIDFDKIVKGLKLSDENVKFRRKNLDEFIKSGFPNKRKEEWKFSDLSQIIKSNIKELTFFNDFSKSFHVEDSIYIKNFEHNKIVFINNSISKIDFRYEEKDKIEIIKDLDLIKDNNQTNTLISLNNALLANYVKITIKQNYSLNKPLVIYCCCTKQVKNCT